MEKLNDIIKRSNPTLWETFEYCTSKISGVAEEELDDKEFYSSKVKNLDVEYTEPYMIFFVLARLKSLPYQYQPMEKVLYVIPFKYKEHYCFFSMEKFGLKFASTTNNEEIIRQLFKSINSANKIANRLLSPFIEKAINNGEFTLENTSGVLRRRYLYFRNNVQLCLDFDHGKPGVDISEIVASMNSRSNKEWEALFNTQAMLDAYFSFQEHILILLLPFSQFNKDEDNITNLIGSDWTTKFNRIFKPQQNPSVMQFYDCIRGIKELRNKYAHGGFEKKKGSLLAHVPTVGAIPVELPQRNERGY
ncbi:hypothetical protein ACE6ED_01065 [Paenibacillus sp. CN-4]|uniref:hypothetical protein n=1 Tax=Paenibacillus nanchangensis TaxID=3348343 RepID=UPI00397980A0